MARDDEGVVAVFRNDIVKNAGKSIEAGRPIYDDIEVCELRYPGSKDVSVFPATEFSHWDDDQINGGQRASLTPSGSPTVPAVQGAQPADQVRHAARLRAVPDRGEARRAARAEHLHRRGARRHRRAGAEEPRPRRPRAEEPSDRSFWRAAAMARGSPSWRPSWRRCGRAMRCWRTISRPAPARCATSRSCRQRVRRHVGRAAARVHQVAERRRRRRATCRARR